VTYVRKKDRVQEAEKAKDPFWWMALLTKSGLADAKKFAAELKKMPKAPLQQFSNHTDGQSRAQKKSKKTK
jgi:hypothetical protein